MNVFFFSIFDSIGQLFGDMFAFSVFILKNVIIVCQILDSMNKFLRVECGFAAVKDIRSMNHEDR